MILHVHWTRSCALTQRFDVCGPDIPPVATVKEDQTFRVETIDWTGGQIKDDDNSDDIKFVDLSQVHYLSGPIRCEDAAGKPAMPGDLLCVEICEVCTRTECLLFLSTASCSRPCRWHAPQRFAKLVPVR